MSAPKQKHIQTFKCFRHVKPFSSRINCNLNGLYFCEFAAMHGPDGLRYDCSVIKEEEFSSQIWKGRRKIQG